MLTHTEVCGEGGRERGSCKEEDEDRISCDIMSLNCSLSRLLVPSRCVWNLVAVSAAGVGGRSQGQRVEERGIQRMQCTQRIM